MLISKKHRKIILNLREPDRVTTVIPSARQLQYKGRTLVAVPHRLDEVRVLRNLGIDAPPPMGSYYDWPGRYKPFVHQRTTAEFLSMNPRAFCLNGMGAGKTISTLWAFDYLRRAGTVRRMLVISPLSTLERAWGDEIFRHFPETSFAVLHGSREKRLRLLAEDFDIYIINHDGIKSAEMLDALIRREGLDLIVVDEVATFRNASADRWKALNKLVNGDEKKGIPPKEWGWGLTGTPTPNAPTDAWAQCRLINPGRTPRYFGQFRDAVMRQQGPFRWVAREGATEHISTLMQPAIRFSREECIDLPPTTYITRQVDLTAEQKKAYDEMLRKFRADCGSGQITAVNEAAKLSKLLQICCLRHDTNVLTERGWVPIHDVSARDAVWDGTEWVSQKGAALMGYKPTIDCGGVFATEDHLVLSDSGWLTAKEFARGYASKRLDWAEVRLPDGVASGGDLWWGEQEGSMGVPVRLRERGYARKPVPTQPAQNPPPQLWVSPRKRKAQDGGISPVPNVDGYASALPRPVGQRLAELRRAWRDGVRVVAQVFLGVLGGYGTELPRQPDPWPRGQRRTLLTRQLSMGDRAPAGQQPKNEHSGSHIKGFDDAEPGSEGFRLEAGHAAGQDTSLRLDAGEGAEHPAVYDLVDCGPRNRFVVRGVDGKPRIVHNCGVAYGEGEAEILLDARPRIELVKEIIEESESKVLVFVPFTAALHKVAEEIAKHYSVEVVYGEVSKTQRDRIFHDFQHAKDPHVLVADARTMSHGLSLTAASTTIWYGPPNGNETYLQANERTPRPGQKLNTLIVNIEGTPVERKVYERLRGQTKLQGLLLDMLKGG